MILSWNNFLYKDVIFKLLIIWKLLKEDLWFPIMKKRGFHQFSGIMKTTIINILVYLHNTILQRSRGLLSDAPVRILIRPTGFPQLCVKILQLWTENFEHFLKVTGPHIFGFRHIFDVDSDGPVQISKLKLLRFNRNKVWIGPIFTKVQMKLFHFPDRSLWNCFTFQNGPNETILVMKLVLLGYNLLTF